MYNITFLDEGLYLKVVVEGNRTQRQREEGANSWIKISNYCNKKNVQKLLIISKLLGCVDQISSYDISVSLEQFGLSKELDIAFVETNDQAIHINSFSKKFATKNGYNIEIFENENEALTWLMN